MEQITLTTRDYMMGRHYYPSLSRVAAPSPAPGDEEHIFASHAVPSPPVTAVALGESISPHSGRAEQLELRNELDSFPKSRLAQDGKRGKNRSVLLILSYASAFPPWVYSHGPIPVMLDTLTIFNALNKPWSLKYIKPNCVAKETCPTSFKK